MDQQITIMDYVSGARWELPGDTPCRFLSKSELVGAPRCLDTVPPEEWTGLTLSDLSEGEWAYVLSDDDGEISGQVRWWLSVRTS